MRFKEKATDLLYDVIVFEDGALIRPASPAFAHNVEKITLEDFEERFDEFYGRTD